MNYMFSHSGFNLNIETSGNSWNVSKVTDMKWMFMESSFNQNLASWDVSGITNYAKSEKFAYRAGFDNFNKSAIHDSWIEQKGFDPDNWSKIDYNDATSEYISITNWDGL